ncbi:hypothetical protein J4438_01010 [Candidatus Woesearchaeota archaeon]|nr:hypothetical protein [Candidatus Woesearchaeota archaeon]
MGEVSVILYQSLWDFQSVILNSEQKDRIGVAYLEYILKVDAPSIDDFLSDHPSAQVFHDVGMRQADISKNGPDYQAFWTEVRNITGPKHYTLSHVQQLAVSEDPWAVILMISTVSRHVQDSHVLNEILSNAHMYK